MEVQPSRNEVSEEFKILVSDLLQTSNDCRTAYLNIRKNIDDLDKTNHSGMRQLISENLTRLNYQLETMTADLKEVCKAFILQSQ